MSELRFKIGADELPFPSFASLSFSDTVIINLVTGLSLEEFDHQSPELQMIGRIAVALQRAHPEWSPSKVSELVRSMDVTGFDVLGLEDAAPATPTQPENGGSSEPRESSVNASESERSLV